MKGTLRYAIFLIFITAPLFSVSQYVYTVEPLSVNSGSGEFAPAIYNNQLFFCSRKKLKQKRDETLTNGFVATLTEDGTLSAAELLQEPLLSNYHDGPFSPAQSGKLLAFSKNYETGNSRNLPVGIFFTLYNDSTKHWGSLVAFPHNHPDYSLAHPSLTEDGMTMYFSSNKPGGKGGSDIYVSQFINGNWTAPQNAGELINTSGHEVFPSYHELSGRLYFASNGHPGFGGLDIYYFDGKNIQVLDKPINSSGDDFGIGFTNFPTEGIFSSSREGVDKLFSYKTQIPNSLKFECMHADPNDLCSIFYESGPEDQDSTPHIAHHWEMGDGTLATGREVRHCYKNPGTYQIKLLVSDNLTNTMKEEQAVFIHQAAYKGAVIIESSFDDQNNSLTLYAAINDTLRLSPGSIEFLWILDNQLKFSGKEYKITSEHLNKAGTVRLLVWHRSFHSQKETVYCVEELIERIEKR